MCDIFRLQLKKKKYLRGIPTAAGSTFMFFYLYFWLPVNYISIKYLRDIPTAANNFVLMEINSNSSVNEKNSWLQHLICDIFQFPLNYYQIKYLRDVPAASAVVLIDKVVVKLLYNIPIIVHSINSDISQLLLLLLCWITIGCNTTQVN